MRLSSKNYFPLQTLVALAAGVLFGGLLGAYDPLNPLAQAVKQGCELAGCLALAWLRALAIPLIFSSIILGGVGLEAMRTMGKVVGKTSAWVICTSLLAVAMASGIAWYVGPTPAVTQWYSLHAGISRNTPELASWVWGWVALVFLSLGFGYYRNQLDEGHGKLMMRFCQALEGMVGPLLRLTQIFAPVAILLLTISATARHTLHWRAYYGHEPGVVAFLQEHVFIVMVCTGVFYIFTLSLVVWVKTRISPWRYASALVPAMALAAAGQSIEAALPLTMETMRRKLGVSNRVTSAVVPLCAVLHRDGVALLCASAMIVLAHSRTTAEGWTPLIAIGIIAFTLGCGGNALTGQGGFVSALFVSGNGWGDTGTFSIVLAWIVVSFGNAISVFSHGCATIIIAHSEGEYWVPGLPPDSDELQELKTGLELADN